jgi:hypothetical protein
VIARQFLISSTRISASLPASHLDPERTTNQERDHKAVAKRERALKQAHPGAAMIVPVGRSLRLSRQREARVLELLGGLKPSQLVFDSLIQLL